MKQCLDKIVWAVLGVLQSLGLKSRLPCVSECPESMLSHCELREIQQWAQPPSLLLLQRAVPMLQAQQAQGWGPPQPGGMLRPLTYWLDSRYYQISADIPTLSSMEAVVRNKRPLAASFCAAHSPCLEKINWNKPQGPWRQTDTWVVGGDWTWDRDLVLSRIRSFWACEKQYEYQQNHRHLLLWLTASIRGELNRSLENCNFIPGVSKNVSSHLVDLGPNEFIRLAGDLQLIS